MTDQKTPKLLAFKVTRTPKLKDSEGNYVKRGETAMLTKELAEHYHELGYVQVSMDGLYDKDEPDTSSQSDGPKPDSAVGSDDEGKTGEDASADVGENSSENTERLARKSRRNRASG